VAVNERLRRLGGARVALAVFLAVEVAAVPLLLTWGNKWWFWADDWDFLAGRTGGNLGDLFRSHYQHWVTLPVLAYRLLWTVFGIRHYVPYQLLVIVLHLIAALLLRAVMRRAGVRPWMATLVAALFVFFGAGAENILIAFQITFVGSLVFGLAQLLLADHDGPVDHRDWFALLAGLAGLMCSGVGVTMVIIVGMAMLLRRGWRIALLQTVPLGVAYAIWVAVSPKGSAPVNYTTHSVVQVVKFVSIGAGDVFGRLGQLPGLGVLLALVLLVGFFVAVDREDLVALRRQFAVPLALFVGAGVFLFVTAVVRAGQTPTALGTMNSGPERARQSRYVYLLVAMVLPVLGIAVDAIARKWRVLTIPVVILLLAGVPGNLHQLRTYTNQSAASRASDRVVVLEAPRLPLAHTLPPALVPGARFGGLSLGWLVDSLPSGRIPSPGPLTGTQISTQTLDLALRAPLLRIATPPAPSTCRPLVGVERRTLHYGERVTLATGTATITYFPASGAPSSAVPFEPLRPLVATTGPLDVEFKPVLRPVSLCG
jgi:hypothetical protein